MCFFHLTSHKHLPRWVHEKSSHSSEWLCGIPRIECLLPQLMIIYFVPQVLVYTNIAQRVYIFYILVDIAKFLSKNGIIYSPTPNITNVRGKKKKKWWWYLNAVLLDSFTVNEVGFFSHVYWPLKFLQLITYSCSLFVSLPGYLGVLLTCRSSLDIIDINPLSL